MGCPRRVTAKYGRYVGYACSVRTQSWTYGRRKFKDTYGCHLISKNVYHSKSRFVSPKNLCHTKLETTQVLPLLYFPKKPLQLLTKLSFLHNFLEELYIPIPLG